MKFTTASAIEQVVWGMKLADVPRGTNRALINDLFNGFPPYTKQEEAENRIQTNVNFLESTKIAHDARRQFYNAFLKPGNFFVVRCDYGPTHKKDEWGRTITRELNRRLKRSLKFLEVLRSTFANVVLHGIGPAVWFDKGKWCPSAVGVEDVLIPSGTLLTMDNLEYFAVFKQMTPAELYKRTHRARVDPGWNMKLVNACIKWAESQLQQSISYAETYSPEKTAEKLKEDLGLYGSDMVQTVDCWEFYCWDDDRKRAGWTKRIILDTPSDTGTAQSVKDFKNIVGSKGEFLYDSSRRMFADKLGQIVHFQFGDASAVAPFRYHSVRSLGFLNYSVCHLQNRLRCKFNDAVFEALMNYFRVNNPEDAERVLKIDLANFGIIPDGVEFVKAQERWKVDQGLVESAMLHNRQTISDNSAAYTQDYDFGREKTEETATATMAKVNASAALIGSMLTQAYNYATFQYNEIARRFCVPNSCDPDVVAFRTAVLKKGVPEEALNSESWTVEPERVLGAGNKTLEIAQADRLMAARNLYDPDAQRDILHIYTEATTDDPALSDRLVPIGRKPISNAVHDAQLATATLMMGLPVTLKRGMNHIDYVETLLANMALLIQKVESRGGMADQDEIAGLKNMASHIAEHVSIIAQDKSENSRVKAYMDDLGNMMNLVKGYEQRLAEAMQQQQQQSGGVDPETQSKVQSQKIIAEAKAENLRTSHAQRTAQRQVQWELEQKRIQEEHNLAMQRKLKDTQVDTAAKDIVTASKIRNDARSSEAKAQMTGGEQTE